jgi:2-polyprenyl-6-methoxyphenol hydroxylase-like FAD-dependent oxidoreductase
MLASSLSEMLALDAEETAEALDWLGAHALAAHGAQGWQTGLDPWALLMQALETRRAHELDEAQAVITRWERERDNEDPLVRRQADRLFDLVRDISAIEAGTRGLSPATTRRLIGLGGHAARLFDRAIGGRGQR